VSIAAGGNFIAVLRMYSERARQRQNASREAAARPAHAAPAEPRQEAAIP
jgi:hypothetical protein